MTIWMYNQTSGNGFCCTETALGIAATTLGITTVRGGCTKTSQDLAPLASTQKVLQQACLSSKLYVHIQHSLETRQLLLLKTGMMCYSSLYSHLWM